MFSNDEGEVLHFIGRGKRTIEYLTKNFWRPTVDNNYIASVVRRIVKKCEINNLPWTLASEGCGRKGKTVWRTKRSTNVKGRLQHTSKSGIKTRRKEKTKLSR